MSFIPQNPRKNYRQDKRKAKKDARETLVTMRTDPAVMSRVGYYGARPDTATARDDRRISRLTAKTQRDFDLANAAERASNYASNHGYNDRYVNKMAQKSDHFVDRARENWDKQTDATIMAGLKKGGTAGFDPMNLKTRNFTK
jgi:hypothetical protein